MKHALVAAWLACGAPLAGAAADALPAWTRFDDPAAAPEAPDPVNAIVSSIVRERQLNPLRAARLYAGVRVAQAEARRLATDLPPETVARLAAAKALTWLLPLEDAARWTAPAIVPVLHQMLQDGADTRRQPLARPAPAPGVWGRTPPLFAKQQAVPAGTVQWREELQQVLEVSRRLTPDALFGAAGWAISALAVPDTGGGGGGSDVPEPASWALALGALALASRSARRRQA